MGRRTLAFRIPLSYVHSSKLKGLNICFVSKEKWHVVLESLIGVQDFESNKQYLMCMEIFSLIDLIKFFMTDYIMFPSYDVQKSTNGKIA